MSHFAKLLLITSLAATVSAHAALVEQIETMPKGATVETPLAFPVRTTAAPKIDGKLDDPCWKTATRIEPMRGSEKGGSIIEGSTGFFCYDKEAIYIGVEAVEGQIDHLQGSEQRGREDVWSGDEMEFFIAPHGDGVRYYQFTVGAKHGQRFDFSSEKSTSYHYEGWLSAVHLDKERGRWFTEVKIPFAAFGMTAPPENALWGFNIGRQNVHCEMPSEEWANLSSIEHSQWSPTGLSFRNVALFGRLWFGDRETLIKRREPLSVSVVLDRYLYDNLDGDAQGIFNVVGGGRALEELSVKLALKRGNEVVAEQEFAKLTTPACSFLMPIGKVKAGKYSLEATVRAANTEPVTATWSFDRVDQGMAKGVTPQGRIALKLPPRDADKRGVAWPVRTGVPMPKGALDDPSKARLLINGKPASCQTSVRGRWSPRGSIRWLGLTFVASDPAATYELEYGGATAPSPASPVKTTKNDKAVTVETGPLRVVVGKNGITSAAINGKPVVKDADGASPYIVDDSGKVYRAEWFKDATVEVEEVGPVHAVVRVDGWFAAKDGAQLCKYTTYYEAFAGLPHVFVDHAVIVTYDTTRNKLKDIGFPVAAAGNQYAIGIEGGKAVTGDRKTRGFAVQDRWNHFVAQAGSKQEGERLAGWADAGDSSMGVTITGQYIPERFPKEFSIDDNYLTYHLWPRDLGNTFSDEEELAYHNIYKLFSAHEGPAMDLNMPKKYFDKGREYDAAKQTFTLEYAKEGIRKSNGQGVAINEPFVITFRDKPIEAPAASAFAKLFEQDPHACADPNWIEQSGVFGPFASVDRERYPQMAHFLGRSYLAMCFPAVRDGTDFGMFNFGDVHTYFDMLNKPASAQVHRVWLNHHHAQNPLPWLLYAYYGESQYLDWARVNGRHTMNIDICHYADPKAPLPYHQVGSFYHVKGFVHWGGDSGKAHHLISAGYLHWAWVWTGNRRARDVASEWIEGLVADSPSGGGTRDGQTAVGEMTILYQDRWDARMLGLIDNFAKVLLAVPLETQGDTNWDPIAFPMYYGLRQDPTALERLKSPDYHNSTAPHISAYLYLLTGEEKYLDKYKDVYERIRVQYNNPEDIYDGLVSYSFLNAGREIPELLLVQKAFEKAGRLIEPDLKRPRPTLVETGQYDRESPRQYTLGVIKQNGKSLTIDTSANAELQRLIKITAPDGKQVDAIPADAAAGLYSIFVKTNQVVQVKGAEPFFLLKAGEKYGLLDGTLATVTPLEGNGPIKLDFQTGDKRPMNLVILDDKGKEVATACSWMRREGKMKSLTIPAGGPYRILTPYPATIIADRDIKLNLHGGEAKQ